MKKLLFAIFFSTLAVFGSGQNVALSIGNENSAKFSIPLDEIHNLSLFQLMPGYVNTPLSPLNVAKSIKGKNGEAFAFLQYVPTGSNPKPLIIFLHGLGERGNSDTLSVRSVENNEIPKLIKNGVFAVDAIVLSPQQKNNYSYWQTWQVKELIDYAKANLNIDPNRIILTGLSMGGGGVWSCLEDSVIASQVSAAVPVCGTCSYTGGKYILKYKIPVWIFHADNDGTVGVGCSGSAYNDLIKKGATNIKFTQFVDGGHGIWPRVYDQGNATHKVKSRTVYGAVEDETLSPNAYQWALAFNKPVDVTPPVVVPPVKTVLSATSINGKTITIFTDGSVEIK